MDFARKQLEKYGWSEGQGLGREKNGIASPIKVKIKRDAGGIGLAPGEEFSHWWSDVFNRAAQNISVTTSDDDVCIERKSGDDSSLSLKARHYGNHWNSLLYGGFLDSTCTYHKDTTACIKSDGDAVHSYQQNSDTLKEADDRSSDGDSTLKCLTDEELLKACGGRTAHKAARHGLKLNGKLKRIQEQEQRADSTCTVSEDERKEALARTSDQVDLQCHENHSRKRKRTRDGNIKKKKRLGV